ncbi:MAG: DALR anticodon-binding domain-containing protein, partial [Bacteroidia bacterium]|nr:DALR anticodon-binding domain-containing protein [Bacteroidia bacterium]
MCIRDSAESIDLRGFTGPFLQYGVVRAKRLLEKAAEKGLPPYPQEPPPALDPLEEGLLQYLYALPSFIEGAARGYNPALLAHYGYELTRRYNELYQSLPVLTSEEPHRTFRLALSAVYHLAMQAVLDSLAIPSPTRM